MGQRKEQGRAVRRGECRQSMDIGEIVQWVKHKDLGFISRAHVKQSMLVTGKLSKWFPGAHWLAGWLAYPNW